MSRSRRLRILEFVDAHMVWPDDATEKEIASLVEDAFAYEEHDHVGLTSLGELEVGYPETITKGD